MENTAQFSLSSALYVNALVQTEPDQVQRFLYRTALVRHGMVQMTTAIGIGPRLCELTRQQAHDTGHRAPMLKLYGEGL